MPNLREQVGREIAGLPVAIAGENDVAVLFHVGHEREDDRAHAGGKEDGAFRAFDGGEFAFGFLLGGIAVTAVFLLADDPALALGLHELEDFGRGSEAEIRGLDDGRGNGVVRLALFALAVNRQRGRTPMLRDWLGALRRPDAAARRPCLWRV